MKYIIFFLCFAPSSLSFSQGITTTGYWGYATGEMKSLKKIMLVTAWDIGYEHKLKSNIALSVEAGISRLYYDYEDSTGLSVFNTKKFLYLPLSVKKYYYVTPGSWCYIKLGVLGSYCYYDKKETRTLNVKSGSKTNNLGYNIGGLFAIGYKKQIHKHWTIDIGISGQQDFLASYRKEVDKIETTKTMLMISFYRILKE